MKKKERIQSLKRYLRNKKGKFINVLHNRRLSVRKNGQFIGYGSYVTRNYVGKVKNIKGDSLFISQEDTEDKKGEIIVTIGLRSVKEIFTIKNPDSLRIKYKLYYHDRA